MNQGPRLLIWIAIAGWVAFNTLFAIYRYRRLKRGNPDLKHWRFTIIIAALLLIILLCAAFMINSNQNS